MSVTDIESTDLIVYGLSHHTVPLEMREHFSLSDESVRSIYSQLKHEESVRESAVLSTCNRLEIVGVGDGERLKCVFSRILGEETKQGSDSVESVAYLKSEVDSLYHLFRVAAGLDSQMVGETEIFGQIKNAYKEAIQHQLAGKMLHGAFQKCFQQGKWARSYTSIGRGHVSTSTVAVELASRIFGNLSQCRMLVVGTGEVAESAVKVFFSEGCKNIQFCGRNQERLHAFTSEFGSKSFLLEELPEILHEFDIVLTSTKSDSPIINSKMVQKALEQRSARPLFFIDLAMPRDVDPQCSREDLVFVYNLDDLAKVANENIQLRLGEIIRCEQRLSTVAKELWGNLRSHQK
ncbi:MAG: glutamyl-tRNA reductase [Verrucomicrobiota bacterium]